MYCIRMKCHVNFDPGGKNSLFIVLAVLIVDILQFNEVHCSTASITTSGERWQRRHEFPEAGHAPIRYIDSAPHSTPSPTDSRTPGPSKAKMKMNFRDYKTSDLVSGQTNDELAGFEPDESTRHSEYHAINSLSALINAWRNLMNKFTTNDLAADIHVPLPKNDFIDESKRTKSFQDEDEINEWKLRDREEKVESLMEKKPSSIHEGDIRQTDDLSWSRRSGGSIMTVETKEHRHLVKRDVNEPENVAENLTFSTENPATNPQVDPVASAKNTSSKGDEQTSIGTPTKSTSSLQTPKAAQTSQKPETSSTSTSSTVQQHIITLPQKTSSGTPSTVHPQQPPKPTTSKKEIVQSHTLHIQQGTDESPTTDAAIEESNAACEGAQCYASRLPYHWTSDASWALASMLFLMSLLTFFVLYTGLWKKRNPMSFPLDSSQPPDPNPKINIADLLKTRLAMIPRHLRSKRQVHRKRMNGRRYEELPLHQPNGSCNDEELDYIEDEEEDLYLRDEDTV